MKKKNKYEGEVNLQNLSPFKLKNALMTFLGENPQKAYGAKQLARKLQLANNRDSIMDALEHLIKSGHLISLPGGRYKSKLTEVADKRRPGSNYIEGKVDMTKSGAAFVITEEADQDIFVAPSNVNSAQDNDRVRVKLFEDNRGRRKRREGVIVNVLERARTSFIGKLNLNKSYYVVDVDNYERFPLGFDVYIEKEDLHGSEPGNMVVVEIAEWPDKRRRHAGGKIKAVMGTPGSNDYEMKQILIQKGFDLEFPVEVLRETERINGDVSENELALRRDFRNITTLTIDPLTAKDFDDALSYRELDNGNIEVGIHIADVTHYVKPGTALDKEAYLRSTSVYLVDRVLPMLPERLSNELCSLRPNEDSLTFSAVFEFDKDFRVVDRWFGKTIIHSIKRLTYEQAQEMIEGQENEYADVINSLNRIALKLRDKRFREGAISFESDEVQFVLDENNKPVAIKIRERKEAHMLVEDFMLLANKEVATFIQNKAEGNEIPFVYRVHDLPDPDRLENLMVFAGELGFTFDLRTPEKIIQSFNRLAVESEKRPELKILEPLAIRTMAKAIYTTDNIGHYGLGFDNYAHFTSPIRRYADVLVHRILEKNLKRPWRTDKNDLEMQCQHISGQERKAMEAERESVSYKQAEYMEKFVGEEFEGVISGMIDRGIFVELLETKSEGLVPFETMKEPFTMAENRLSAVGKSSGVKLKLGQKFRVRISGVDLSKKNIDMVPA